MKGLGVVLLIALALVIFIAPMPQSAPEPASAAESELMYQYQGIVKIGDPGWKGTCGKLSFWVVPVSVGAETAKVLVGNPNYELYPIRVKLNGELRKTNCLKIEAVMVDGTYAFKVYKAEAPNRDQ